MRVGPCDGISGFLGRGRTEIVLSYIWGYSVKASQEDGPNWAPNWLHLALGLSSLWNWEEQMCVV